MKCSNGEASLIMTLINATLDTIQGLLSILDLEKLATGLLGTRRAQGVLAVDLQVIRDPLVLL